MSELSIAEEIARRTDPDALLKGISPQEMQQLAYDWRIWQRPKQKTPEGNWSVWLILAGRGFGKTRTGAEWVREQIEIGRASCRERV